SSSRGRLAEDPPVKEADVQRVEERIDEEQPEDRDRHERERVAPARLAQASAAQRDAEAAWRGFGRGRGRHHRRECPLRGQHRAGDGSISWFYCPLRALPTSASIAGTDLLPEMTAFRSLPITV